MNKIITLPTGKCRRLQSHEKLRFYDMCGDGSTFEKGRTGSNCIGERIQNLCFYIQYYRPLKFLSKPKSKKKPVVRSVTVWIHKSFFMSKLPGETGEAWRIETERPRKIDGTLCKSHEAITLARKAKK